MHIRTKICMGVLAALVMGDDAVLSAPLHHNTQRSSLQRQPLHSLQRNYLQDALPGSPVIILMPQSYPIEAENKEETRHRSATTNSKKETVDEELESVIVEADPEESDSRPPVVLVLPSYARLSIGDIISAIPFLPVEINVPDAVGWAYGGISSGISSIISIFGRWPFTSSAAQDPTQRLQLKSALQQLGAQKRSDLVPIVILPIVPRPVPIRLPIQV